MTPQTTCRDPSLPLAANCAPGLTSSPAGGAFSYSGVCPHPRRAVPGICAERGAIPSLPPGLIPGWQPVTGGKV